MNNYTKKGIWDITVFIVRVYILTFIPIVAIIGTLGVAGALAQNISSIMPIIGLAAVCSTMITATALLPTYNEWVMPAWRGETKIFPDLAKLYRAVMEPLRNKKHNEKERIRGTTTKIGWAMIALTAVSLVLCIYLEIQLPEFEFCKAGRYVGIFGLAGSFIGIFGAYEDQLKLNHKKKREGN